MRHTPRPPYASFSHRSRIRDMSPVDAEGSQAASAAAWAAFSAIAAAGAAAAYYAQKRRTHGEPEWPWPHVHARPVTAEEWVLHRDERDVVERTSQWGLEEDARRHAWPALLGVVPHDADADVAKSAWKDVYRQLREQAETWTKDIQRAKECGEEWEPGWQEFDEARRVVRVDVVRTELPERFRRLAPDEPVDLSNIPVLQDYQQWDDWKKHTVLVMRDVLEAYAVADPTTSYAQGMSDLLVPLLAMVAPGKLREEAHVVFACFSALMNYTRHHFLADESGIRKELNKLALVLKTSDKALWQRLNAIGAGSCMFAYRMYVVMFRRELSYDDAGKLWDIILADRMLHQLGTGNTGIDLRTFIVASIVLENKWKILFSCTKSDDMYELFFGLKGRIPLAKVIHRAKSLRAKHANVWEKIALDE